jgi:glycosyltransferase involved in cell wall biosynthesis
VLRHDSPALRADRPALCLVANDFDYVMRNGGIGTYNWLKAHLLARQGWYVHVLYCGAVRHRRDMEAVAERLGRAGIGWSYLEDFEEPPTLNVPGVWELLNERLSERARYALEELHAEHHFDLAEFGEWGGLGFRSVQARQAGLAFGDLRFVVKLHSSSQWMREGNHQWLDHPNELGVDFLERYAFENADFQTSPSAYMLDYARKIGWNVRPDARVVPYPYPDCEFVPKVQTWPGKPEVVFFGRLETRKGLEVFVQAVRLLDPAVRVAFVGRVNVLSNNMAALDYIKQQMKGRPYTVQTDFNREQALRYLSEGNRLAVIPSLSDNAPFAVIECATNGIPFIASRVGGIPELVSDPDVQQRLLFDTTPRDLLRCLRAYLLANPAELSAVRDKVRSATDVDAHNQQVADEYDRMLRTPARPEPPPTAEDKPLVTVAIAYYNLGAYLPQTLASLAEQTYPNLEVLVINDGSTDPYSRRVFTQQQALYPQFRFLSQPNAGIGATRNRALTEARGAFFLPMDADNVARPEMVERLVRAIQRNPDLSAVTCYYLAFRHDDDLEKGDFPYAYRPTGGPHVLASFRNVYGDANALFRTEAFRSVGGFETDRNSSWEDWEAFVKLVNAGHRIDTLPDYLFYYRHLEAGFSRTTDGYLNQQRVLRQFYPLGRLPTAEGLALWTALVSLQRRLDYVHLVLSSLRYRVADRIHSLFSWSPPLKKSVRWVLLAVQRAWETMTRRRRKPARRAPVARVRMQPAPRAAASEAAQQPELVEQGAPDCG